MNEENHFRRDSAQCEEIVRLGKSYNSDDKEKAALLNAYVQEQQAKGRFISSSDEDVATYASTDLEYQKLDGQYDMRVLELCPGTPGELLALKTHLCSLEFDYIHDETSWSMQIFAADHALSLRDGKPVWYTAISYVWGDSIFSEPVICDGKDLKITRNLSIMLNEIRHPTDSFLLWIDQVCINQQDLAEKSQQVLLMGKIYSFAHNTLVWLGPETDDTSEAIGMVKAIGEEFYMYIGEPLALEATGLPAAGSSSWTALSALLARPWFQRVWIIQEWILSRRIRFQCGKQSFSEDDLEDCSSSMDTQDLGQYLVSTADVPATEARLAAARIRKTMRTKIGRSSGTPFIRPLNEIVEARGARATNPLDKVLAVMGMASLKVYPDYTKSTQEIYLEAAKLCLVPKLSDLLCCIDHEQPPTDLPSWVPDWTQPRVTNSFGYSNSFRDLYKLRAPEMSQPEVIGTALSLSGALHDSIASIAPFPSQDAMVIDPAAYAILSDLPIANTPTAQFILFSLSLLLTNCQTHPTDAPNLYDSFWHTLVGDQDETGWRNAPEDYAEIFSVLLEAATGKACSIPDEPVAKQKRRLTLVNLESRRPSRVYRQLKRSFETAVKGRVFATTKGGKMGLFPRGGRVGDEILFFAGAVVPFVVRKAEEGLEIDKEMEKEGDGRRFRLIGECYIHGLMQKTALDEEMVIERILLV